MDTGTFGVISPHPPIFIERVGGRRSHETQASLDALTLAGEALAAFAPETLVLMSPHAPGVVDAVVVDDSAAFAGSLVQFGDDTPFAYRGDPEFATALIDALTDRTIATTSRSAAPRLKAGWLDHASIVPLAFLDPGAARRLVIISLSWLPLVDNIAIGESVRSAATATGRKVAFIASGDLSHRLTLDAPAGYAPEGEMLDSAIREMVTAGHLRSLPQLDQQLVEAGGECGLRSIIALGGFCAEDPAPTRVLAYEGPWGVGYLTAVAGAAAIDALDAVIASTSVQGAKGGQAGDEESEIVALARARIVAQVTGVPPNAPVLYDPELPKRAGAFVSLHREGVLRGCIGTILPTRDTLAEEVAANAVEAAVHDPRFPPLTAEELADLEVKVDVLRTPESCTLEELDPSTYGVIVSSGWRRGLLLPDLEGVDDVTTQIEIAMRKAGIRPEEPCSYERFRVDRYT